MWMDCEASAIRTRPQDSCQSFDDGCMQGASVCLLSLPPLPERRRTLAAWTGADARGRRVHNGRRCSASRAASSTVTRSTRRSSSRSRLAAAQKPEWELAWTETDEEDVRHGRIVGRVLNLDLGHGQWARGSHDHAGWGTPRSIWPRGSRVLRWVVGRRCVCSACGAAQSARLTRYSPGHSTPAPATNRRRFVSFYPASVHQLFGDGALEVLCPEKARVFPIRSRGRRCEEERLALRARIELDPRGRSARSEADPLRCHET
ncbi:hypothetical protein C8Q77DRAFT_140738 [Trametes polyzona]|nr:hypothetical protein C8Q77DRAFT_140738 [Trametes polyzona]